MKQNDQFKYVQYLNYFVGKVVLVKDGSGDIHKGKCMAVSSPYMNIIIHKPNGKQIAIRNVSHIEDA